MNLDSYYLSTIKDKMDLGTKNYEYDDVRVLVDIINSLEKDINYFKKQFSKENVSRIY